MTNLPTRVGAVVQNGFVQIQNHRGRSLEKVGRTIVTAHRIQKGRELEGRPPVGLHAEGLVFGRPLHEQRG